MSLYSLCQPEADEFQNHLDNQVQHIIYCFAKDVLQKGEFTRYQDMYACLAEFLEEELTSLTSRGKYDQY